MNYEFLIMETFDFIKIESHIYSKLRIQNLKLVFV
jgi:hypothetical protein